MRRVKDGTRFKDNLNFLLTNRLPRALLTRFMGWFSKLENPVIYALSMRAWQWFCNLDLAEAKKPKFSSMHDCFTRELKEGARPIDLDPGVAVSPCDAIIGSYGRIEGTKLIQIKGSCYTLEDLLGDSELVEILRDGAFVTLRITASMYHRFHAPDDLCVEEVCYISGDTWNVNPPALQRVEKLFCKNERAIIRTRLMRSGLPLILVPVAAILVAGIRLHFVDVLLHLRYPGPNKIACKALLERGEEMGWFEHGSTIIVFAPCGFLPGEDLREGERIRVGQRLLHFPEDGLRLCRAMVAPSVSEKWSHTRSQCR